MSDNDLVSVMVPKRHLAKVYGFIASLDDAPADRTPTPSTGVSTNGSADTENDEWTISHLRKMLRQSPPAMRDILVAMAQNAGNWMATRELAEEIQNKPNADWKTVAGTMGAFGRRVKNRYGMESFPFERRYDHEARSKAYRMSEEMAAQVLELANEN